MRKEIKLLVAAVLAFAVAACSTAPKITQGSVVKIEYKGTKADGKVFDSTEGKAPLAILVGANQVLPKFEEQITKLRQGQKTKFTIKAVDAYGEPKSDKVVTLPRDQRFNSLELKEGNVIFANNKLPNGKVVQTPMKIVKVSDKDVTLDYNHPLAGEDLTFEVKIVEVQQPQSANANATAPTAQTTQATEQVAEGQ
jgi:FKBP-type peptidyl-prolyl cis-trans isomerase 2